MSTPDCCRHCGPNPDDGCAFPDREFHNTPGFVVTWYDENCPFCDTVAVIVAYVRDLRAYAKGLPEVTERIRDELTDLAEGLEMEFGNR